MSSYLFLEISLLVFVFVVTHGRVDWRVLTTRFFLVRAALLFGFWFVLDELAVWLGLWYFPAGGTLPFRFAELPLEEYLLFFVSSVITLLLVRFFAHEEA